MKTSIRNQNHLILGAAGALGYYIAIEAALTIRMVLHLPLRQTEGFLRSLTQLLGLDLPISDHTTLSRRLQTLRSDAGTGQRRGSGGQARI